MTFFRVGTCLALLTLGAACTQAPQTATSPTASTGGSTNDAADGSTLKVTAPGLVSPTAGERAEDRNPTLIWLNSNGRYGPIGVAYDIELWLATGTAPVYQRTVGENVDLGAHRVELTLDYDQHYSWRVRAHVGNPDTVGPWSSFAQFISPTRPVAVTSPTVVTTSGGGCAAPISPLGAGETRKPRPNHSSAVRAVASQFPAALRNSCQDHGGSWEFMDRSIDALRLIDGRYGYNAKRGNMNDPSLDVVSYFFANGTNIHNRHEVYIFDIIAAHCGTAPGVVWNDVTDITSSQGTIGRTMFPRPGRSVPTCAAAAGQ